MRNLFLWTRLPLFLAVATAAALSQQQQQQQQQSSSSTLCTLSVILPFHDGSENRTLFSPLSSGQNTTTTYHSHLHDERSSSSTSTLLSLLATTLMAIQDFNHRNSSLPHIHDLLTSDIYRQDCAVEFPLDRLIVHMAKTNMPDDYLADFLQGYDTCGGIILLGSLAEKYRRSMDQSVSQALQTSHIPIISLSYRESHDDVLPASGAGRYTNWALGTVTWSDTMEQLLSYVKTLGIDSIAILLPYAPDQHLADEDMYSYLYNTTNNKIWDSDFHHVSVRLLEVQYPTERGESLGVELQDDVQSQLETIRWSTSIRTIVVTLPHRWLPLVAQVADDLRMLDDDDDDGDYLWILMDGDAFSSSTSRLDGITNTAIRKLLRKSRVFGLLDAFDPHLAAAVAYGTTTHADIVGRDAQTFVQDWSDRSVALSGQARDILNAIDGFQDLASGEKMELLQLPPGASLVYDAVLAMGIAACDQVSIQEVDFDGASGRYNLQSGSLDVNHVTFGVLIVQEMNAAINDTLTDRYEALLADMTVNGVWGVSTATSQDQVSSGTYRPPAGSITSVVLATLANAFALGSGVFFYIFRNNRIVSVGQPPFLYMICFGAMLVASSLYFTAYDEGAGRTVKSLNASCVASAWFSYMGNAIVYMSLFSKLWRVLKVTEFRRRQTILVQHVIWPMVAILLMIVGILIAYTILDPPRWTREDLQGDPLVNDDDGTFGFCSASTGYTTAMDVLIVISILLALFMSCRTRERLPEDLTDARRVTQTLCAHFLLSLCGIIVAIAAAVIDSTVLFYGAIVVDDVLSSIFSVAFLSIPKMYYVRLEQVTGELPEALRRGGNVRVSGLNTPSVHNMASVNRNSSAGYFTMERSAGDPTRQNNMNAESPRGSGYSSQVINAPSKPLKPTGGVDGLCLPKTPNRTRSSTYPASPVRTCSASMMNPISADRLPGMKRSQSAPLPSLLSASLLGLPVQGVVESKGEMKSTTASDNVQRFLLTELAHDSSYKYAAGDVL